ncbi:MAG: hypothetical protein WCD70_10595 [Alphaproteobacteria bacterium]
MTISKIHSSEASNGLPIAGAIEPQHWMNEQSASRKIDALALNANQLTSLSAMIAYAASKSGQSEYRIERSLSDCFKVPNAKFIPANDFDAAIRYLADIIPM